MFVLRKIGQVIQFIAEARAEGVRARMKHGFSYWE